VDNLLVVLNYVIKHRI